MPDTGIIPELKASRRRFLQGAAAATAGLVVGFRFTPPGARAALLEGDAFAPNAFIRIAPDDTVTFVIKHLEMGQGTYTGLATVLAEELDADWSKVRAEHAPADASRYYNTAFSPPPEAGADPDMPPPFLFQGTGGSNAMANSYQQMRRAGARARAMLVAAAAAEWGVPAAEIAVAKGIVSHAGSGKSGGFGALAAKAAALEPPAEVTLKDPAAFTLIGTRVPRLDVPPKTKGQAQYTLDVYLPDMLTAVIARSPRFGGKVKSFDATAAKAVPGVVDVVQVPTGVAVLAKGFWPARQGREALTIEWDDSGAETRGSAELFAEYRKLAETPGLPARLDGDPAAALAGAAKVIEAVYEFPYLAHAPMEPLDCVIRMDGADGCEALFGSQTQSIDQMVIAGTLGLAPEKVKITTLFAGGSFGRRSTPGSDIGFEAASLLKAIGGRAPVKLVWTREDDIRGGMYRPLYVHKLRAGLDADGKAVAWEHRIVGQSILGGTPFESFAVKDGIDMTSVEGARNLPYAIPNLSLDLHTTTAGITVLWWRSVGSTHNGFSTETMIDELAEAAGQDPVDFRRALLADHPRHRGVLDLAAEKAGWGSPLPEGMARGVAVHESFQSFVAQVAEVSIGPDGLPKVHRVVCAVDCGVPINPDVIAAQMESGIGYGLNAVLYGEIAVEAGRVVPGNFDVYLPLRIDEMPAVEVHIVPSTEPPTGVGEPGTPPIGPAVANAMRKLTGKPVRRLPFTAGVA